MMFDAETGNYICNIDNMTTIRVTAVYGKDRSILYYNLTQGTISQMTKCRKAGFSVSSLV